MFPMMTFLDYLVGYPVSPSLLKGGGRAPSVPMITPPGCPEAKAHALEKKLGETWSKPPI